MLNHTFNSENMLFNATDVISVNQSGGRMKLFAYLNVDEKEKDEPTNAPESGDKKPDQK